MSSEKRDQEPDRPLDQPQSDAYRAEGDLERWEKDFDNEYPGRPDDPDLEYDRDRSRKY